MVFYFYDRELEITVPQAQILEYCDVQQVISIITNNPFLVFESAPWISENIRQ